MRHFIGFRYAFLKSLHTTFIRIPALTTTVGIDDEGSFKTLLALDSEGQGIIFTSY